MTRVPVTWVKTPPLVVTHIKSVNKDGYWAVQFGIGEGRLKKTTKSMRGHLKGALEKTKKAPSFLREVRLAEQPSFKVGDIVRVEEVFKKGDIVQVSGVSKGKGFAGVVKRWGFAGGPRTHGQSDRERAPGSIGQGTTPGRVYKGKHMAGRMGGTRVSVRNLTIVDVTSDGKLAISGAIPGRSGALIYIKRLAQGNLAELEEVVPAPTVEQVEEAPEEAKTEEKETKEDTKEVAN